MHSAIGGNGIALIIFDFNPVEPSWYWLEVEDIHGYKSIGNGYFILDEPPSGSSIRNIEFVDSLLNINWTVNTSDDFDVRIPTGVTADYRGYSDLSYVKKTFINIKK